jgi:uracil-DNA glycosylase
VSEPTQGARVAPVAGAVGPQPARPHPLTGQGFRSPVSPGTGWPGDPATPRTPVADDAADVLRLAGGAPDTAALDARVSVCRACPRLVTWREEVATTGRRAYAGEPYWGRPVPGFGDPRAGLLVVGLAPAAHGGNRTGRVFTGDRSGDWIVAALHRAGLASQPDSAHAGDGLALAGARIAAPVRCAPPGNAPTPGERDTCAPWFDREVALVRPRVLLALGSFAWAACLGAARRSGWAVPRPAPRFGHGARAELGREPGDPVTLLGSYHVSQQNTFTGRLTAAMLDDVVASARAALEEPGGG